MLLFDELLEFCSVWLLEVVVDTIGVLLGTVLVAVLVLVLDAVTSL